jgi:anti-sigma28 factor (negative regulator of flagellin synthesis)
MKIDPKRAVNFYETQTNKSQAKSEAKINKDNSIKRDRVEISSQASKHSELIEMKEKIASEVGKGASPERLQRLKIEIKNGTYSVSSLDIADSILKIKSK